jgi:hypothetical protein
MDFIQPIGPDRDLDPLMRVERARDERERREQRRREEREDAPAAQAKTPAPREDVGATPTGPVEGDDGRLHIDTRA